MDANEKAKNTLTVIQSVTPPFVPADAEVMTLVIEYPPGDHRDSAAPPPRRALFRLRDGGRNGLRTGR